MIRLSIVVPSCGRPISIKKLLISIDQQDLEKDHFEVLLVHNGPRAVATSTASYAFNIHEFFLSEANKNKARDYGLSKANGGIVYFLDDDCWLPNKYHLSKLLNLYAQNPQHSIIGGLYKSNSSLSSSQYFYNESVRLWAVANNFSMCPAGNLSLRRNCGLTFAGTYHLKGGGEENILFQLAQSLNLNWLITESLNLAHQAPDGWMRVFQKAFLHGKARNQKKKSSLRRNFSLIQQEMPVKFWLPMGAYALADFCGQLSKH